MAQRKDCTEQYFNSPEEGVFPMSKVDVNILDEIFKAVEIVDSHGGLVPILRKYKSTQTDEKILSDLIALNSKLFTWEGPSTQQSTIWPGEGGGSQKEKEKWKMIDLRGEELIASRDVKHIKKHKEYSNKENRYQYFILINPIDSHIVNATQNIKLSFNSEKERDNYFDELYMRLGESGDIEII